MASDETDSDQEGEKYTAVALDAERYLHIEFGETMRSLMDRVPLTRIELIGAGVGIALLVLAGILIVVTAPQPGSPQTPDQPIGSDNPPVTQNETDTATTTSLEASDLEQAIHDRVNEMRGRENLSILTYDTELVSIARGHSRDMVDRGYFSHESPDGEKYRDRYAAAGYNCTVRGEFFTRHGEENLARLSLTPYVDNDLTTSEQLFLVARRVVNDWLNRNRYSSNLMAPYWTAHGIGVQTQNDTAYITQNFC